MKKVMWAASMGSHGDFGMHHIRVVMLIIQDKV